MNLEGLSKEYRLTAAMLAMKIDEHKKAKDIPAHDIQTMESMLRDVREIQRTLACYYDWPRPGAYDMSTLRAPRYNSEKK